MKRSTRLLIGFVAAALTYASLMAFAGPHYRSRHGLYPYHAYSGYDRHHCGDHGSWKGDHPGTNPRQENPPADIPRENQ
jgi:hypothetical protein